MNVFSRIRQFGFILSSCILFLFAACSGSQGAETANFDKDTLRSLALERENKTLWTRELEAERLLQNFSAIPEIAPDIRLEPRVVAAAEFGERPEYPFLPGFGKLDTAGISKELLQFLEGFCASVSVWDIRAEDFADSSIFSAVLFKNDVEKSWKAVFGTAFPIRQVKKEAALQSDTPPDSSGQSGGKDKKSGEPAPQTPKQKIFTSYIYGAPFAQDGGVLVPVRFYAKNGILDAALFIDTDLNTEGEAETPNFKISQIQIIKLATAENAPPRADGN
ncbi:MAG: hypothetical protein ACTTKL_05105 [Treponema sp.]